MRQLVATAAESADAKRFAMLWLASYIFLLRVPSEALPMRRGGADFLAAADEQSLLFLNHATGELCLKLHRRKNRQQGSTLRRICSCSGSPELCPIHVLWEKFFLPLGPGEAPWHGITANQARARLRGTLQHLQVGC